MPAEDLFDITQIDHGKLDEGEKEFFDAFNAMVRTLEDLERDLLAKSAIWQGEAKTVFDEVRKIWQTEARDMGQFVNLLKENINITNMNMKQVDRINSQIFDGR
jgi:uncharacterized protein YukE